MWVCINLLYTDQFVTKKFYAFSVLHDCCAQLRNSPTFVLSVFTELVLMSDNILENKKHSKTAEVYYIGDTGQTPTDHFRFIETKVPLMYTVFRSTHLKESVVAVTVDLLDVYFPF